MAEIYNPFRGMWDVPENNGALTPKTTFPSVTSRVPAGTPLQRFRGSSIVPNIPTGAKEKPVGYPALNLFHEQGVIPPVPVDKGPENIMLGKPADNTLRLTGTPQPALPAFDPSYQNKVDAVYGQQKGDIDSRYGKGIDVLDDLAKQYSQSQGSSFGGLMANQQAIASVNALQPAIAKGYMESADRIGALPLMSNVNEANKVGGESRRKAQQSMFDQSQPSALADLDLKKAQTGHALAQTDYEKNRIGIERAKILAKAQGIDKGSALNPADLLKAQQALKAGLIDPEQFNAFIKAGSMYKHPSALPTSVTE